MPMQLCHCGRPVYQEPVIKTPAECRYCRDERENELRREMRKPEMTSEDISRATTPWRHAK